MWLSCQEIFEVSGASKKFSFAADFSENPVSATVAFRGPVQIDGEVANRAGIVTLDYTARFTMSLCCDRCLKPFSRDESLHFTHGLVTALEHDADDAYFLVVPDMRVDLAETAWTDILLELPAKVLCREDCKGLCPVCGQDWNLGGCSCDKKEIDPRWKALDGFFSSSDE